MSVGSEHPLRVVLDTNVVLSAVLFRSGRLSRLRWSWQAGWFVPVANTRTVAELTRVLGYTKFKLSVDAVREALDLYVPYVEVCQGLTNECCETDIPTCRDPKDQMFLDLAVGAKVDALITGDDDLLTLAPTMPRRHRLRIQTPQDFLLALPPS